MKQTKAKIIYYTSKDENFTVTVPEKKIVPILNSLHPLNVRSVGFAYPDSTYKINHKMDFNVIEFVISGKGYVSIEGVNVPVLSGDVYFIPFYKAKSYCSDKKDPYHTMWINFRCPVIESLYVQYFNDAQIFHAPELKECFLEIFDIVESRVNFEEVVYKCLDKLFSIFCHLAEKISTHQTSMMTNVVKSYIDGQDCKADGFESTTLTMSKLSNKLNFSKSTIYRTFKKDLSISPKQYSLNRKFRLSQELLIHTTQSVKEISKSSGFNDPHYFSYQFKKRFGCTPLQYRKKERA